MLLKIVTEGNTKLMAQMILKIVKWRVIQIDGLNVTKNSNRR